MNRKRLCLDIGECGQEADRVPSRCLVKGEHILPHNLVTINSVLRKAGKGMSKFC